MKINNDAQVISGEIGELANYFYNFTVVSDKLSNCSFYERGLLNSRFGIRKQLREISKRGYIGKVFYLAFQYKPIKCTSNEVPSVEFVLKSSYVDIDKEISNKLRK